MTNGSPSPSLIPLSAVMASRRLAGTARLARLPVRMGADSTGFGWGAMAAPSSRLGSNGSPSVTAATAEPAPHISTMPGTNDTPSPRQLRRNQYAGNRIAAPVTAIARVRRAASRTMAASMGLTAGSRCSSPAPTGPMAIPARAHAKGSDTQSCSFTTPDVAPSATSRPNTHSISSQISNVVMPGAGMAWAGISRPPILKTNAPDHRPGAHVKNATVGTALSRRKWSRTRRSSDISTGTEAVGRRDACRFTRACYERVCSRGDAIDGARSVFRAC